MHELPTESGDDLAPIRAGVCAIVGLPNVGKSTLLNQLLGIRIAAVSAKPQTTRNRILGVRNCAVVDPEGGPDQAQIVVVDTPGVQHGKGALRSFMQEQALSAAAECDLAIWVVDASTRDAGSPATATGPARALGDALGRAGVPVVLVLNKVDRLPSVEHVLPIIAAHDQAGDYAAIVPMSALKGDGIDRLEQAVARRLPVGPRLFPDEMYTDRSERFLAGELIREQLFRQLGKEVPYASAVVVEAFEDRRDRGDVVIRAVVHVERDSQKGIVVGKGGQRIKEVGQRAREAISHLLGCPVHLTLHVLVSRDWSRIPKGIREMGYE